MGASTSKAARKLPRRAETPTWAGARTPTTNDTLPRPDANASRRPLASETKSEDIERDSRDPQLLSNLSRLGPVRVDHHMQSLRPADLANRMHSARLRAEADAAQNTHNRLLATSLTDMLEERKLATSLSGLEKVANKYDMDVTRLQSIARFVNSPSRGEDTAFTTIMADGTEEISITAVWEEPSITDVQNRIVS